MRSLRYLQTLYFIYNPFVLSTSLFTNTSKDITDKKRFWQFCHLSVYLTCTTTLAVLERLPRSFLHMMADWMAEWCASPIPACKDSQQGLKLVSHLLTGQ